MPSVERTKAIIASLKEQISSGDLCDVLFYNKTGSVWAHSCVLAAFSPILSQMISLRLNNGDHWSIRQPMQISVNQVTMSEPESEGDCLLCVSQVISYIYTGTIDIDSCHKEHVHALSEHFQNCELLATFEKYGGYEKPSSDISQNVGIDDRNILIEERDQYFGENGESKNGSASLKLAKVSCSDSVTNQLTSDVREFPPHRISFGEYDTIVCDKCSYLSRDRQLIDVHRKVFHNSNYYKCLHCKFHNRNLSKLVEHIVESCHFEGNAICSLCLFKGTTITELLSHVKIHRATEPFECALCPQKFKKRNGWLKHVVSHYPKHEFSCKKCELSFTTDRSRIEHCGPGTEHQTKKNVCLECGFVASYNYVLEKHKLKHRKTRYKCGQTDCTFNTSSEAMLVRHKAVHKTRKSQVKDDECPECKMKFTLIKNLKRHMKIHASESTKIKCSLCKYETLRKDKLREHCMVKHVSELENEGNVGEGKTEQSGEAVDISEPVHREIILGPNGSKMEQDHVSSTQSDDGPPEPEKENVNAPPNHNTLLMDSKGDISIVNSDKNNSVTLRNIGNLTGSITLDEKTGVLTMNNINSGSVFLNETTGELTYVNLEPQKETESSSEATARNEGDADNVTSEITKLDEFTGEIVRETLPSEVEENSAAEPENDPCDMDLNDDSLDGFDDFDELLFDVFNETETADYYKTAKDLVRNDVPLAVPRLDESTGLLTFDDGHQQQDMWNDGYSDDRDSRMDDEHAYQLLLDEVTGVLHI